MEYESPEHVSFLFVSGDYHGNSSSQQQGHFHRVGVEEKAKLQMEYESPEHVSLLFQAITMATAASGKGTSTDWGWRRRPSFRWNASHLSTFHCCFRRLPWQQQGHFHRLGVEEKAKLQMEYESPEPVSLFVSGDYHGNSSQRQGQFQRLGVEEKSQLQMVALRQQEQNRPMDKELVQYPRVGEYPGASARGGERNKMGGARGFEHHHGMDEYQGGRSVEPFFFSFFF